MARSEHVAFVSDPVPARWSQKDGHLALVAAVVRTRTRRHVDILDPAAIGAPRCRI
jgi:hypothetical protein